MMFSLIFFSWCAQEIGNIFGNLAILIAYSEKKKKIVFFPKKLPFHAGVFRGARFSKNACVGGYQRVVLEYIWEPRHFNRLFRQEKSFVSFDRGAFGRPISITLRPLI